MTLTQINKAGLDEIALDHVFTIGASGTDHYTFQGEGLNGTVNDPTLYLIRGKTYRFENGTGAHPIRIQSTSGASGTAYNTGVTNNAGSGTVIVEVQHDAPDILYYQCTSHANMNGILYIVGAVSDGSITTAKIAADAIDGTRIADNAVANEHIASGQVTTVKIADNNVTTAKILDGNITSAKLATDAVTTAKITDANVTTAKIADDAVTAAKIADGDIANTHISTTANIARSKLANVDVVDDSTPTLGGNLTTGGYDIQFQNDSGTQKILFDASDSALEFVDGAKATFGTGGDLEIVHNGVNTQFTNTTGNLEFVTTNTAQFLSGSDVLAKFIPSGACEVYHNGSKKFETSSAGVSVTGTITGTSTVSDSKGDLRKIIHKQESSAYTLVAADAGKAIEIASGGITVPASVFSAGDAVTIINDSSSSQTITKGSGLNMFNSADATNANRTLGGRGMATIYFVNSSTSYISGAGLS